MAGSSVSGFGPGLVVSVSTLLVNGMSVADAYNCNVGR